LPASFFDTIRTEKQAMMQLEPIQQKDFERFWKREIQLEGSKQESDQQAGFQIAT
jgi:hypothetical protein